MKYFKNITSYKNLKDQYKKLIKVNHPDAGGNKETMQEINVEYEILFKIWKDKAEKAEELTEEEKTETAQSTKRTFYTAYGWEGSRYDSNLTLKEIAKIVRGYVKEKYPTCKFSIRTHYASMCQSLSVDLLEFPEKMYIEPDELETMEDLQHLVEYEGNSFMTFTDEAQQLLHKLNVNGYIGDNNGIEEIRKGYRKAMENSPSFYGIQTEYFKEVVDDVNAFVASYNYNDSDGMIDYFDVNFYDGKVDASACKYVPKMARIKEENKEVTTTEEKEEPAQIEKGEKPYTITESKHTKTGETIFCVKWLPTLSRDEYITLNNKIKSIGGYYSKFTHSFIFKSNPEKELAKIA